MLLFLIEKSALVDVLKVSDDITVKFGIERMKKLSPVFLTDN